MQERFLVLGKAGSGKTHLVIQKFLEYIKHHKEDNVLFILPTHSQVEHLRDHILRISGIRGYLDSNLVTFHGLAKIILDDLPLRKLIDENKKDKTIQLRQPIGENEKEAIPSNLFRNISTKYFTKVLDYAGFKRQFLNFIREIKENSLDPPSFKTVLKEVQSGKRDSPFNLKCNELVTLYDCYQQTLKENGLVDKEDFLAQALRHLNENKEVFSHVELLLIDGFHDYTQLELGLIKQLTPIIPTVFITLPYQTTDPLPSSFKASHKTYSRLEELGLQEKHLDKNRRTSSTKLKHIEANIFSNTKGINKKNLHFENDKSLQIIVATNIQDEVEQIARRIRQLTYRNGYNFGQIGVIFRNVARYQDIIEDTFTRFDIPFRIYAKKPLKNNPLIKAILNTTKIFTDMWQDDSVWRVLRSNVGISSDLINRLELKYSKKGSINDCDKWIEFTSYSEFKPVNEFLTGIKNAFSSLEGKHPFGFYCRWYINIVNLFYTHTFAPLNNGNGSITDKVKEEHHGQEILEILKADAGALREFLAILNNVSLNELVEDAGNITFEEFNYILDSQIAITSYGKIDRRKDVVNVIDVLEARQWEIPVVFVGGLLEKEFPRQVREDLFIKDFHRRKLNETGKIVLREADEQRDEERYLFYIAITRAKERLYLTYPSTNSDGNMTLPSFFLSDIKKLLPDELLQRITIKRNLYRIMPAPEEIINSTDVRNYVYYHFNSPHTPTSKQYEKDIALWLYNNIENAPRFREQLYKLRRLINYYGDTKLRLLDKDIIKIIHDTSRRFSPTKLRDFAQCPYKYFGGFTLNLKPVLSVTLDSPLQGTIIHMVLKEYFERTKEKEISKIFEEIFNQKTKRIVMGLGELKIKNEMLKTLLAFESKEKESAISTFKHEMFEEEFGKEKHKPLEIMDSKTGCIEITGKIDRIDVSVVNGKKVGIIIDYKYGKTEFKLEDIEEGTDLQLPIYVLALRDVFKIVPVAAEFHALKSLKKTGIYDQELINEQKLDIKPSKKSLSVDSKEFNKRLEDAKNHILHFSRKIHNGKIELAPHNLDLCGEGRCDFANVCRVDKWRVR